MSEHGVIGQIWRYPVKSLGGESITAVVLDDTGIPGDRCFALRDLETGKIISAKLPQRGGELLALTATIDDSGLIDISDRDGSLGEVGSAELDATLSRRLGLEVQVVHGGASGEVYASAWPELDGLVLSDTEADLPVAAMAGPETFVDLAPLHLVTTSSMRELARRTPQSVVTPQRFRPSLVVETDGDGWVENDWCGRTATIGGARLTITLPTPRCVMTTLAQPGLPSDRAVLQTLADGNRVAFGDFGEVACLGVYAEVEEPGPIAVGDPVVLDRHST